MKKSTVFIAASILAAATATPAMAGTGCNGVINPFVWGCAPWDNNNGPQFPYYKKTRISIPVGKAQVFEQNGARMVRDLRTGQVHPMVAAGGGNIIAAGAGN